MQQLGQRERKLRLRDAATQQPVGATNLFERPEHVADKLGERVGPTVRQGTFGMDPHAFVRVDLGGVEVLSSGPRFWGRVWNVDFTLVTVFDAELQLRFWRTIP
jgi:hypothetical protein